MGTPRSRRRDLRRRSTALSSLFLAAALVTRDARAGDTDDIEGLLNENVVSGASKSSESSSDAPATVVTLTNDEMNRYGMRSLAEAINFLGMGLITQDPLHSVEIGGRGVLLTSDYGNHVLVVVDGHSINEGWDNTAYFEQGLGIPLELVDHIELILGPGAVLYGNNAMLAVINVVTKRARNYRGLHAVAEGGLSPQQSNGSFTSFAPKNLGTSYRLGLGVGYEFELFGHAAEITGQAEYYEQDGPPFTWNTQHVTNSAGQPANFGPNSPLGTWGGVTTNDYSTQVPTAYVRMIVGDFTLALRGETYGRTTPYVNEFNEVLGNFNDPSTSELDRWLSADLQYKKSITPRFTLKARAYVDSYDYQQHLVADDPTLCPLTVTGACKEQVLGVSRWGGVELQGSYDWFGNGKLDTLLGSDTRVRYVGATTNFFDGATGKPVGSLGAGQATDFPIGIYLQQRWTPVSVLHLNAGARFDSDVRGGQRLSPRAAASVDLWKGGTIKGIYSEAFRAPSYYEFYYAGAGQIANPALKAETERGVEVSFEQTFGAHRILFGVFRSWWSDMIQLEQVSATGGGTLQYINSSTIDNYGYNGMFDGRVGRFHYGGSITGAYAQRTTSGVTTPLTVAPSLYGNVRASFDLPGSLPVVAVATNLVGPRLADRALDGNFPTLPVAPLTVGIRATISGDVPPVSGLSYRVSWDYSTGSVVPYVAGPNQYEDPTMAQRPQAELAPVNRMTAFATLRYTFPL